MSPLKYDVFVILKKKFCQAIDIKKKEICLNTEKIKISRAIEKKSAASDKHVRTPVAGVVMEVMGEWLGGIRNS